MISKEETKVKAIDGDGNIIYVDNVKNMTKQVHQKLHNASKITGKNTTVYVDLKIKKEKENVNPSN